MPRFVIHWHAVPASFGRGSHWDVMLEMDPRMASEEEADCDRRLLTWAVERLPTDADRVVPARQLRNHRLAYLDYEGPVPGGRGTVHRRDSGSLTWIARSESLLEARVVGTCWTGVIRLELQTLDTSSDPRWSLEFMPDG